MVASPGPALAAALSMVWRTLRTERPRSMAPAHAQSAPPPPAATSASGLPLPSPSPGRRHAGPHAGAPAGLWGQRGGGGGGGGGRAGPGGPDGAAPPRPPRGRHAAAACAQARGVRAALRVLEQKLEALEQQQEAVLGTPLPDEGLKRDLQVLRDEIQGLTQEIRTRLRVLEPGKEEEEDENRNTIGARVKRTQHAVLSQQFLGLTGRCHAAQARYRQRSLERIRRQLHITGSASVTEEELEQMLETGQSEVFISNVLGATRATRAALEEVGVRHRELQRLEKGLRELGELFTLLGSTLEAQGEVIDRIERNIEQSGSHVRKGQQHLGAAQRSQRGARRSCWWPPASSSPSSSSPPSSPSP
ncbi:syntaxin-4-like isoform X2 [Strix uralensis]|uniref:syntaxin-4-like isoform X2 n=1 Tax=Strix uralensis TaxID=36305 RepID=UPI003DA50519